MSSDWTINKQLFLFSAHYSKSSSINHYTPHGFYNIFLIKYFPRASYTLRLILFFRLGQAVKMHIFTNLYNLFHASHVPSTTLITAIALLHFIFGSPSSKIVLAPFSFSTWGSKAKRGRLTCQRSHPRHWPKPVVLSACVATITFVSLGLELLQQGKPSSFDTTDAPKNMNKVKGLLNWCFSH